MGVLRLDPRLRPQLAEALDQHPSPIRAFVLLPNHWHGVLWPEGDRDVRGFGRWLTHTHRRRWPAPYHTAGTGPIPMMAGSTPTDAYERIEASGFAPLFCARMRCTARCVVSST